VTQPDNSRRLERLREVRSAMEGLHADALAERDGRAYPTEESVAILGRPVQDREASGSFQCHGSRDTSGADLNCDSESQK
jgi:hypothetical protein